MAEPNPIQAQHITNVRRELVDESNDFHERAQIHSASIAAVEPDQEVPDGILDAYEGLATAGAYAWTMAAMLRYISERHPQTGLELTEMAAVAMGCGTDWLDDANSDLDDETADVVKAGAYQRDRGGVMTSISPAHLVAEFHTAFGLLRVDTPAMPSDEEADFRHRLLVEEIDEVGQAMARGDLVNLAQELADVVYVTYGTALTYGINLDAVLAEVHRANMAKLGSDGRPTVRDGKIVKPDGWQKPDVAGVLGLEVSA